MAPPIALWGVSAPVEPLLGGHRNQVWRTRGLAQELVFKTTIRSEAAMAWLLPVQEVARDCGFDVPELRRCLNGTYVAAGWTCETLMKGAVLPRAGLSALGPSLAPFHSGTTGWLQRPGFESSQALISVPSGGDVDLTRVPADVVALCRAAWAAVQAAQLSVVHGDLAEGNVLRGPNGRIVLLDWDECRVDLALFDTAPHAPKSDAERRAHLAWEVACSWQREPEYARDLAERLRNT